MFELKESWTELVLRSTLLFAFLLIVLRFRNRTGGELSSFDQVILITLGNLVAAAALKSDDSVLAAIISIATFVILSGLINKISYHSRTGSRILEGAPRVLVHNGIIIRESMSNEQINEMELMEAVRTAGIASISDVHVAILETNGQISVVKKSGKQSD